MAVFDHLGVLSTAQDFSAEGKQTENILDLGLLGISGFGPGGLEAFMDVETETAAGGDSADTYVLDLIVALTENLNAGTQGTDYYKVLTVDILNVSDPRIATAGRKILTGPLPDQVWEMAKEGFRYCGFELTISAGSTLSINAGIVSSKPRTQDNVQVVRSNVSVPT